MKSILSVLLLLIAFVGFGQVPNSSYVVEVGQNFSITGNSSSCFIGSCSGSCSVSAAWYQYGFEYPSGVYYMPSNSSFTAKGTITTSIPTVGTEIINYVQRDIIRESCGYSPGSFSNVFGITIYSEASLTFTPPVGVCNDGAIIDLKTYTNKISAQLNPTFTLQPSGATIAAGLLDPTTLSPGTHTIRARYNFHSGFKTVDQPIIIYELPQVSSTLAANYCANGTDLNLNSLFSASPTGSVVFSCVGGTCNGSMFYNSGPNTFLNLDFNGTASTFNTRIRATYTSAQGCVGSDDVEITINANPTNFTVSGGGAYCSGGTGVDIFLSGTQNGVNYQLRKDGVNDGAIVAGSGSSISWTNKTASGTYTVIAITAASCSLQMTNSATVTINPLPTQYIVGGGGAYCSGGTGVTVTLSDSDLGINYQLRRDGSNDGAAIAGSGSALNWANKTNGGTYTVVATNTTTTCSDNMTGSTSITINPLPTAQMVSGGGSYCAGGTGVTVSLFTSQAGISYQLRKDGINDGSPIIGTGASVVWNNKTAAGNYTVIGTNTTTTCSVAMTGSVDITINSLPTTFTVAGGGTICSGAAGVNVTLSASQIGINYQLRRDGSNDGTAVAGSGSSLVWANKAVAGAYTVVATNASTSCVQTMAGSATIVVNPLPNLFTVSGGGSVCGGAGLTVTLSGSTSGVNYQLLKDGVNDGSAISGTGSAINWTNKTTGVYTVVATIAATSCNRTMTGSASVTLSPAPTIYTVSGSGSFCSGGTGLSVSLSDSEAGVNYQLKRGGVNVGTATPGTGNALSWNQTIAGTYTVTATHASSSCVNDMTGSAVIVVNPAPSAAPTFTVSPSSVVCGNTTFTITAAGLVAGEMYRWTNASNVEVQLSTSPTYTTVNHSPGTHKYYVQRRTSLGCLSSATEVTLEVNASATINWTTPNASVCGSTSGMADLAVLYAPTPSGGAYSSTNTTLQSKLSGTNNTLLNLAGLDPGTYPITYTVTGSCSAVASTTLVVKAGTVLPVAADVKLCGPGTTTLEVSNVDATMLYEWFEVASNGSSIGSGATFTTPELTANKTYYVQATNVSSACVSARDAVVVTVVTLPTVNVGPDIGFCTNAVTVNLAGDASPAGGVFSGEGVTGSTFNGNLVANNATYTITYTVTTNGCEVVDTREISLGFDIELEVTPGDTVELGELVTIKHNYSNAVTSTWNFGDGWSVSALNAIHYYYQPGNKNVTLSLTLPGGCSQTRTFDSLIFVNGDFGVITGGIENEGPTASAYPNPIDGELNLLYREDREDVLASISDLTGRPVTKSPVKIKMGDNEILSMEDTQALAPGMYLIKLSHNNSTQYIKIIKK